MSENTLHINTENFATQKTQNSTNSQSDRLPESYAASPASHHAAAPIHTSNSPTSTVQVGALEKDGIFGDGSGASHDQGAPFPYKHFW